jgi:hypothetical protein
MGTPIGQYGKQTVGSGDFMDAVSWIGKFSYFSGLSSCAFQWEMAG